MADSNAKIARKTGTIDKVRKKITHTHDLISTSWHESGHVIFALLCGMRVPSVYVFENKKNKRIEGFCHYESVKELSDIQDSSLFTEQLKAEISIKYAGLTAEKHYYKIISGSDKFPMFLKDGSSPDISSAADLIKQYNVAQPGKKRYAYKKSLIREILLKLQDHWDAVTAIAHGLIQKKRLFYADIKKILIRKTKNKVFWKEQFKIIDHIFNDKLIIEEADLKDIF